MGVQRSIYAQFFSLVRQIKNSIVYFFINNTISNKTFNPISQQFTQKLDCMAGNYPSGMLVSSCTLNSALAIISLYLAKTICKGHSSQTLISGNMYQLFLRIQ